MFFDIIFFLLVSLYSFIATKIIVWRTLSILGFESESPVMYLQNPLRYEAFRSALFLLAIASYFFTASVPGYIALPLLAASWYMSVRIGKRWAFSRYRSIIKEMIVFAEDDDERQRYREEIKKSNKELIDQVIETLEMEKELRLLQSPK